MLDGMNYGDAARSMADIVLLYDITKGPAFRALSSLRVWPAAFLPETIARPRRKHVMPRAHATV